MLRALENINLEFKEDIMRHKFMGYSVMVLLIVLTSQFIGAAEYNRPSVKTQKLYLNNVEVTATAAELNKTDGLDSGDIVTTTSTSTMTNKTLTSPAINTGTLTSPVINTAVSGTAVLDEDTMASNSATQLATQQSIKAYVDSGKNLLVQGEITDVSSAASSWAVSPVAGDLVGAYVVIDGAITVADASITFEIGGVAATGTLTVAYSGSAAGSAFSQTISGTNTVTAGQAIEIITDGGSTDAAKGTVVLVIQGVPSTPLRYIQGEIADISTGASSWTVSPIAGTITNIWTVIDGAIITVDAGITFELGGTAITGGDITIAFSGSAAGVVDTAAPTALNTVTAGQAIEIITDGASTNAVKAEVLIEITP